MEPFYDKSTKPNLEYYINILQQYVPSGLLNSEYLKSIRKISSQLPLLSSGCFEFWLGESQPRVDLNIAINRVVNEHKTIVAYFESRKLHSKVSTLEKFIKRWSELDLQLWLFVQYFWLVYDIPDPQEEALIPWYYISYNPSPLFNDISLQAESILATLALVDEQFSSDRQSKWELFFNNTLAFGRVQAIGFQTNRQIDALRVNLIFDRYMDIYSFLRRHNWPGGLSDLHMQLDHIADGCDTYGLSIDVTPVLQPKISVEFLCGPATSYKKYKRLTDKLIDLGLCTEAKQKAFLEWEGEFDTTNDPNVWSWPNKYTNVPDSIPKKVNIRRGPKHVKVVYNPGNSLIGKGYLGFHRQVP